MGLFHIQHWPRRPFARWAAAGLLAVSLMLLAPSPGHAQTAPAHYTINGQIVSIEVQQMMMMLGLAPGHYYVDAYGNLGVQGQPPMINLDGGPPRTTGPLFGQGVPATPTQPTPVQPAPVQPVAPPFAAGTPHLEQQLAGVRLFWVFSSRLGYGGSSGYFHLCPNNVFHRSAESSFRVGGDYDIVEQRTDPSVAAASTVQESGNWRVEQTQTGPMAILFGREGVTWEFRINDIQSGHWHQGDFEYAAEVGQASCG